MVRIPDQASCMRVQIAKRTAFQSFDGRRSVFAEASQRLYELNPSALAVLAALDEPLALPTLQEAISPRLAGGRAALNRLLVEWSNCGLIELLPEFPDRPSDVALDARLDSPGTSARLHCLGKACDWFSPYGHLPEAGDHGLDIFGQASGDLGLVCVAGGTSRLVPRPLLAATFRFHLVEALLGRSDGVAVHCAVLVKNNAAIMLMGPPGTGKSTMALFAEKVGFAVGCDDIAFLEAQNRTVLPLALPLTLKSGSWDVARAAGIEIDLADVVPRQDGIDVLYLQLSQAPASGPIEVRSIVKLDRVGDDPPTLAPWSKTQALEHLCSEARSRSGHASVETFRSLIALVEKTETVILTYSEAEQAASLLESHVSN